MTHSTEPPWKSWDPKMRKEFSSWVEEVGGRHEDTLFLTGDLGYNALENVARAMGKRFINVGVCEQNMISLAAGLAQQGLSPFCYSIAPFAAFRPAEQIRLDVCIHNMNVKIIGNGGGYGYGIMGATHHAIEDLAVLSSFPNMRCYVPVANDDVESVCDAMYARKGPSYLRLGHGVLPEGTSLEMPYAPVRRVSRGTHCTIVGIGPVLLNALHACSESRMNADIFVVSEVPLVELGTELEESLRRTGRLLVIEEHVRRGGLGEMLAEMILARGLFVKFSHQHARGYPDHLYGSQAYHQKQSGLDPHSLMQALTGLSDG